MDILTQHIEEIKLYCEKNNIKKLSLFGSYLKNRQNENSDIDFLIEFQENTDYGFLDLTRMERELSEMLGNKVDLRTPNELSRYFKDDVVREAEVKYEGRG